MTRLMISAALIAAVAFPALAEGITLTDGYARAAAPTAKAGAAFLTLENTSGQDDRLIGVASEAAARVQLHTHQETDGVMRMVHVEEGFALPAGETFTMERGGAHVMLMGLTTPLEAGAEVTMTLTFEQAGDVVVTVPVDLARTE